MKLQDLKNIELIASDFDVLLTNEDINTESSKYGIIQNQYANFRDCPIARALKRLGFEKVEVDPDYVDVLGENRPIKNGYFANILEASILLGDRAENYIIEFKD